MNIIFKKLNFKDTAEAFVIQAPASFKTAMEEMAAVTRIRENLKGAENIEFFLAFVTTQKEVDTLTKQVTPSLAPDGLLWFASPKGSSKKYTCEFNRDNGWNILGEHGFEPVRMVAIDEDWSALRFRKTEHIKKMTRSTAISKGGKERIALKVGKTKKDSK